MLITRSGLLFILFLFFIGLAKADTTIYVSPISTCISECGTQECPCISLKDAITVASNYNNTLITITCGDGTYSGSNNTNLIFPPGNTYQLISVNGSKSTILSGEVQLENSILFTFDSTINTVNGFTIQNFETLQNHFKTLPTFAMINNATVTFEDILVQNNYGDEFFTLTDSQVTIQNSTFFNNTITGISMIYFTNSSCSILNTDIKNSTANRGNSLILSEDGGVIILDQLTYINNTGDSAISNLLFLGISANLTVTVTNSIFETNSYTQEMLKFSLANVVITNVTFNENRILAQSVVLTSYSSLFIDQSNFKGNSISSGGVLSVSGMPIGSPQFKLTNSYFSQNSIILFGIMIYISGIQTNMTGNQFEKNLPTSTTSVQLLSIDNSEIDNCNVTVENNLFLDNYGSTTNSIFSLTLGNHSFGTIKSINFTGNAGTYEGSILLLSTGDTGGALLENLNFYNNEGGGLQLQGNTELINSKFYDQMQGPILIVQMGNHYFYNLTFNELILSSAVAAIYIDGEDTNVEFYNCSFYNNFALSASGVVQLTGNSITTFRKCIFESNLSSFAGGVAFITSNATGIFEDSVFSKNQANIGGAIAMFSGSLFLNSTLFTDNTAIFGGSIYISGGTPFIENTIFNSSYATISGGALGIIGETAGMIMNTVFYNCSSDDSGGIAFIGDSVVTSFSNCSFTFSSANSGGAISFYDLASPTFIDCQIENNLAYSSGGAILAHGYSTPTFNNCNITSNVAYSMGGACLVDQNSSPTFNGSLIYLNYSPNEGGGFHCIDRSTLNLIGCSVLNNNAGASGGGVSFAINATGLIQNTIIKNNTASSKGGGIVFYNNCCPVIDGSTIANNTATSGAGIWISDNASPQFTNTEFIANVATSQGAGCLASDYSKSSFSGCSFKFNIAVQSIGGAMVTLDSSNITIYDSEFIGNFGLNGGAIYASAAFGPNIFRCNFEKNVASINGGAFDFGENGSPLIVNTTCSSNNATSGGCVVIEDSSSPIFINCNILNNFAKTYGGGVTMYDRCAPTFISGIIDGNVADIGGGFYSENCFPVMNFTTISENYAQSRGGGGYLEGTFPQLNSLIIEKNVAIYGGGLVVESNSLDLRYSTVCRNCIIKENIAGKGGGIYLELSSIQPPSEFNSNGSNNDNGIINISFEDNINHKEDSQNEYTFLNSTIIGNRANYGGGIYSATVIQTVTFGPLCFILGNYADNFGGGIYITNSLNVEENSFTWINGGIFYNNTALYGGYNSAWFQLTSNYSSFCFNCTYGPSGLPTGYSNAQGFATAPTAITLASPCPTTATLDATPFSLSLVLVDNFETTVTGKILSDNSYNATVDYIGDNCDLIFQGSNTQPIDTGMVNFDNLVLKGKNSSNCELVFTATSVPASYSIKSESCNITLDGCSSGEELTFSEPYDYCIADHWPYWKTTNILIAIIALLLLLVLCLIVTMLARNIFRQRQKNKKYQLLNDDIPDLESTLTVTLDDILNDPSIPRIPWEQIIIEDRIGVGASGIVSKGKCNYISKNGEPTSVDIATKELLYTRDLEVDPQAIDEFLKEVKLMSNLKNDYIVEFLGVALSPANKLFLVTELMHQGSLRDVLDKKGQNLPWKLRLKLLKDAAKGMAYLHSRKIIHRDLKPQNLLVNSKWVCKVADFGISTISNQTKTMTCIGTPVYMAIEVLTKDKYSEKADVYSFAVMIVEVYTGARPYTIGNLSTLNQAQLMFQIIQNGARPDTSDLPLSLSQLVFDCWNEDPRLRPSFAEIIVRLRRLRDLKLPDYVPQNNNNSFTFTDRENSSEFGSNGIIDFEKTISKETEFFNEEFKRVEEEDKDLDSQDVKQNSPEGYNFHSVQSQV